MKNSNSNKNTKLTQAQKRAQRMGLPIPVVAKAKRKAPTKKSKTADVATLTFRIIEINKSTFTVGVPSDTNHKCVGQDGGVQFIRTIQQNAYISKALKNEDTNVLVGDAKLTFKNFIYNPEMIFFIDGKTEHHGLPNSTYTEELISILLWGIERFNICDGDVNFWELLYMCCNPSGANPKANPNAQSNPSGAQSGTITRTAHSNHGCFGKNYGVRIDRGNGWEEFANWPTASKATNVAMGSLRGLIGNVRSSGKYAGWKVERMN